MFSEERRITRAVGACGRRLLLERCRQMWIGSGPTYTRSMAATESVMERDVFGQPAGRRGSTGQRLRRFGVEANAPTQKVFATFDTRNDIGTFAHWPRLTMA
jgi:hypothetical protein